jgi:beta-lactamase regulating signal transducer with metallopeptidase domain
MMLLNISRVIAPVFYKLLYMSIAALVIGIIILLVRKVADKHISPFWKSMMWLLVLFALIIPYRPQSNLAILNKVEKVQDFSIRNEFEADINEHTIQADNGTITVDQQQQVTQINVQKQKNYYKSLIFDVSLPLLWFCGVALIALFMLVTNIRLKMKINQNKIDVNNDRYHRLLEKCIKQLGITRNFEIIVQDYIGTPALMGINPKIILPVYMEEMEDQNVEYILLHELTHYRRGDMILNHLLIVLQIIYWFNPLTWMLFKFIRQDMELANDGAVLKTIGNEKQREYSRSLIAVLSKYNNVSFAPKLLCMVDNKENMERRIKMIKLGEVFKKKKVIISLISLVIIGVVSILFLTSGRSDKIPSLYVSAENNKTIEAIRGGYSWEFGSIFNKTVQIADALSPVQMDYKDTNIVTLEAGQQIVISNQKMKIDKRYKHISEKISVYTVEGTEYDMVLENYENVDGDYYLNAPQKTGEYIYAIEIEYERGTVTYGFKVVVADVIVSSWAKELYENKNPYIGGVPANVNILELLNISSELGKYTLELQTSNEPYGIKLIFKVDSISNYKDFDLTMQYNAYLILALIDNAGVVEWEYPASIEGKETLITRKVTASEIQGILGHDVKEFGKSAENLQMLIDRKAKPQLTLDDVLRLSAKGEELSWQDFEPYQSRSIGSGLYILYYVIDNQYSVWVGGGSTEDKPFYIRLYFKGEDGSEDYIDLWKDNVEQFIHKHREDADTIIEDKLKIIMSSPKESSNPLDYISAHKEEFDAIVYFDSTALFNFYTKFEKGGQTGLEGQIMAAACREILVSEWNESKGVNGQEWYDAYKEYVLKLRDEQSEEFIQQNYPKAYKLLKMLGETGEIGQGD